MGSIQRRADSETSLAMIDDGAKLRVLKIVTDAQCGLWARLWGDPAIMDCGVPPAAYSSPLCLQLWSFTVLVPAPTRCLEFNNISIRIPATVMHRKSDRCSLCDCLTCMSRSDAWIGSGLRTFWLTATRDCPRPCCSSVQLAPMIACSRLGLNRWTGSLKHNAAKQTATLRRLGRRAFIARAGKRLASINSRLKRPAPYLLVCKPTA